MGEGGRVGGRGASRAAVGLSGPPGNGKSTALPATLVSGKQAGCPSGLLSRHSSAPGPSQQLDLQYNSPEVRCIPRPVGQPYIHVTLLLARRKVALGVDAQGEHVLPALKYGGGAIALQEGQMRWEGWEGWVSRCGAGTGAWRVEEGGEAGRVEVRPLNQRLVADHPPLGLY